mgnify:CR=1 FL=1
MSDDFVITPVFKALSRPMTIMGVDYDYFFIVSLAVMLAFVFSGSFKAFLLLLPLHLIGWILCRIDRHIFKILSVRASIGIVRNYALWRCQSYAPF